MPAKTHKIIKVGSMLGITFPKKMVEENGIVLGTKFDITYFKADASGAEAEAILKFKKEEKKVKLPTEVGVPSKD